MRLAVVCNSMGLGGSQLNAVELAEQMHRRGHHVVVFGPPGGLSDRVQQSGMAFVPAPRPRVRPSVAIMRALNDVVVEQRIDLVHGYEWPPALEAFYGPFLRHGTAAVGTVMSMGVAPFIPRHLPLVVGTEQIADVERRRRTAVHVIEPPVDVEQNRPDLTLAQVRDELGMRGDELLVVVVSRLARELKREGILAAVRAVTTLAASRPVRLVVVGDGPARSEIEAAAAQANCQVGREIVTLLGSVPDPRSWYAAADITLGMGSSALRAMAFAKPLVVQGELGFWRLLAPETLSDFLYQGWYGLGDGGDGAPALARILAELGDDPSRRSVLGEFARSVVVDRFSVERAADLQEKVYADVLARVPSRVSATRRALRPAGQVVAYEARRRYDRLRGQAVEDDFNAIAAQAGQPAGGTTR